MAKQTNGIISTLDMKRPGVKLLYWGLFAFMAAVSLVCLLPPLWIMLSSLKDVKEFFTIPPTIIPKTYDLSKVVSTWKLLDFGRLYWNTLIVTAGCLFFALTFNGLLGYFLSKLRPKGSAVVFGMVLWTMLLPNTLGMVPIFKNIIDFPVLHLNFSNTFWPMWMMAGANAFFVIVFKGFFDNIPQALIEAARMDGCSPLGIFRRIVLPLSKPVMMAVTIFTIHGTWSDFFWPYMVLKEKSLWTVIVAIYNMKGTTTLDIQFIALTFSIIPPAILFLFFQKYIMQGFTFSGIKG
ncbi:carbohydrate ABC transporter permease [Paenibacillus spongiae]|uniref:Carbohydrate ABC transporter permease n=1 Tax=Paenibacillus spongiae TaxID=2909671 RepID=A0ABY5S7U5_9BACL|nr:carbohydrate ABC transporter permease [Paenibacillus spongiae]UVI29744.1 carbohydrate ABC transporter permease [Paenibacillus spongiae]